MKKVRLYIISFLLLYSFSLFGQQLEIHHIDVGQADATLIKSPTGVTVLIDGGNNGNGTSIIHPYLTSLGITTLNYIMNSHYHADHLGGLDEIITEFGTSHIDAIYDRGSDAPLPTTQAYTDYATAANATGKRHKVTLGQILDLGGGVTMKCVATNGQVLNYGTVNGSTGSENDLSVGWILSYNQFQYYTGGDLGGEVSSYSDNETPLAPQVGDVDAMKIDHHGSQYSSNQTFINTLKPEVAFIECGNGNTYGHPVQSTLNRLAAANCFIYQTELGNGGTIPTGKGAVASGTVVLKTSGTSYTVTYGSTTNNYAGDGILPVELVSFTAEVMKSVVELHWNTATELDNYGFEIERKSENTEWNKIGFVQGGGNSNKPLSYSFADHQTQASKKYFYRLKQIDRSGGYKYHEQIEVNIRTITGYSLEQNYPNPANPSTTISFSLPKEEHTILRITDTSGKVVQTLIDEQKESGVYFYTYDGSRLSSGTYFIELRAGSFHDTKKMQFLK